MITVTIPIDPHPWWRCVINGKIYSYPSGTVQSVPDEVANLIADSEANRPQPRQYDPPAQALPDATNLPDGMVLTTQGGAWVPGSGGGGGSGETVYVPFTVGQEGASTTASFSETAAAMQAGKTLVGEVTLGSGVTVYGYVSWTGTLEDAIVLIAFVAVCDFADPNETPNPQYLQIRFGAGGVTTEMLSLTVSEG